MLSRGSNFSLTIALTGIVLPLAIVLLIRRKTAEVRGLRRGLLPGLLLITGLIHLGLVREHLTASPKLGLLFALDGAAFCILAMLTWRSNRWRSCAAALLLATIVAYLVVVGRHVETVDDLGLATKLIELGALGLIVWPARPRFSLRLLTGVGGLLLAIGIAGAVAWGASLRPEPGSETHDGRVLLAAAPPTASQRAAAAKLVADTRAGIARYADVQMALADGYRPSTPASAPSVHYVNQKYQRAARTLDPERPEALVYATTPTGAVLLGAMYMLSKPNVAPPDIGGTLAEWHAHANLCFTLPGLVIDGLQSPFGTCPIGSINGPTPAMLHVWTVPNASGPFAEVTPSTPTAP